MRPQVEMVHPPRIADWLVNLFISTGEAESIPGDLREEFSQVAAKSGVAVARSWYWRQTVKTIAYLAIMAFRVAPWSTAAVVVAGFLLGIFVHGLPDKLLSAVTDKYLAYWSTHFEIYKFLATEGMFIAQMILSLLLGCIVSFVAKGREMVATGTLALVFGVLSVPASVEWLARTGDIWMLSLQCGNLFAIVIGGAIVRMHRSTAKSQLSRA